MNLCIVPMKPLARAKARLAEVLSPEQRRALSLAMLEDVIGAARALDHVWVLHSDDDAAEVIRRRPMRSQPDTTACSSYRPTARQRPEKTCARWPSVEA